MKLIYTGSVNTGGYKKGKRSTTGGGRKKKEEKRIRSDQKEDKGKELVEDLESEYLLSVNHDCTDTTTRTNLASKNPQDRFREQQQRL